MDFKIFEEEDRVGNDDVVKNFKKINLILFLAGYNIFMNIFYISASVHSESFGALLEELIEEDVGVISRIFAFIKNIAQHNGHPQPPHAKPIRGVEIDLCEIRITHEKGNLLRIYYVADKRDNTLKILNYIVKPDGIKKASNYEGKKKKKLDKIIQQSIELAVELYQTNKQKYEPLTI